MGKHLTKTGIAGYGLLLAAASISVWSFSYARFTAQENGMAAATVAAWGSGSSTIDINVSGLRPGDKKPIFLRLPIRKMESQVKWDRIIP